MTQADATAATPSATDAESCTLVHEPSEFESYTGPERRVEMREWRACVDHRLDKGAQLMRELRTSLDANTQLTQDVQTNTSELVSLLNSFKGAFKVFNLIGKAARPLGWIAGALASLIALYAAWKGGGPT